MPLKPFRLLATRAKARSGCLSGDTERGLAGAAGGAVSGGAGCFCRDLDVPGCRNG